MAKIVVSFTVDSERDRRLVRWLGEQANRSAAIRRALEAELGGTGPTLGDVYQAIKDLDRKLAAGAVMAPGGPVEDEAEREEIPADVLDALDGLGL